VSQAIRLAQGHWRLGLLESRYELVQGGRRVAAALAAVVAAATGYVILQIALVRGLMAVGLPLGAACLLLAAAYLGAAWGLVSLGARRNPAAGRPYQGSRDELQRSMAWIHQRFS
jgi:hypothetical protein